MRYFTVFLPSSTDASDKKACKTDRFKLIFSALKPGEELLTKARVKFLLYICELTQPFLKQFQSATPNIHNLFTNSTELFEAIAKTVMKPKWFRKIGELMTMEKVDWFDSRLVLPAAECSSLVSVMRDEIDELPGGIGGSIAESLLADVMFAVNIMLDYLFKHLPIKNHLLKNLGFLHPRARNVWDGVDGAPSIVIAAVNVAKEMKRFDENEIVNIQTQLAVYQSISSVPDYEEKYDRVDSWWVKVFALIEKERASPPLELMKLVKMTLVLAHSQGWVERGFNISKMFANDRESLSVQSIKALKMVFGEIRRQGGADKVYISNQMLNSVKMSGRDAKEAASKEKERKEREAATEVIEKELERKRKKEADAKKDWEARKDQLETDLRGVQAYMDRRQTFIEEILSKVARISDPYKMKDYMTSVRLASEEKQSVSVKERLIQEQLRAHIGKRRRIAE